MKTKPNPRMHDPLHYKTLPELVDRMLDVPLVPFDEPLACPEYPAEDATNSTRQPKPWPLKDKATGHRIR